MFHKHDVRIGVRGGHTLIVYCKKCKKVLWWEMNTDINKLPKLETDGSKTDLYVYEI